MQSGKYFVYKLPVPYYGAIFMNFNKHTDAQFPISRNSHLHIDIQLGTTHEITMRLLSCTSVLHTGHSDISGAHTVQRVK